MQVGYCEKSGVYLDTNSDDCHLLGCVLYNNVNGVRIRSGSQQITACHLYDNSDYNIWFDRSGSRTKIGNCKIEGAGKHGVYLDNNTTGISDVQVVGCNLKNNGDSTNNSYDHIRIRRDTATGLGIVRITIVGNNLTWIDLDPDPGTFTPKPKYGVNIINNDGQHINVQANSFGTPSGTSSQFGTGPINQASNNANKPIVQGNINVVTENRGTVSISAGSNTSGAIAHGLALTPGQKDILVTPQGDLGGNNSFWVTSVTSTSFTIRTTNDLATSVTFAWQASVRS